MILLNKKHFSLTNITNPPRQIYSLIVKNLPNSIFSKLDFLFLKNIVKKKILQVYVIKKKERFSCVITITTYENYNMLRNSIILYLLKNPIKILLNIKFIFDVINRDKNEVESYNNNKYLHLLHFIILKKQFNDISLKAKDNLINFFLKEIVKKNNANHIYLCYEKNNLKAHKYYKRNKFKIYKKNKKVIFIKKRII